MEEQRHVSNVSFGNYKPHIEATPPVIVEKIIRATPQIVFDALTQPELIKRWWGPHGFSCPSAKVDLKRGGKYHFCMRNDDGGKEIWSTGEFLEIEAARKVSYTDFFANKDGEIVSPSEAGVEGPYADIGAAVISFELSPEGDSQTKLVLRHEGLPERIHDECVDGWNSSLDKFRSVAESEEERH